MLNISFAVTMPHEHTPMIEQLAMEISMDTSILNGTLWDQIVAQGVDNALAAFYGITGFGYNPARPAPPEEIITQDTSKGMYREGGVAFLVFVSWVALLALSRRNAKRAKMTNWARIANDSKHLTFTRAAVSFSDFKSGATGADIDPVSPVFTPKSKKSKDTGDSFDKSVFVKPRAHKKEKKRKKCIRWYGMIIVRAIEGALITGWRFVIGFGLLSLTISSGVRGARFYESVPDESIDANMAGCAKILEVLLPLTCFTVGMFVFMRLMWLHNLLECSNAIQRHMTDISLICCSALPHQQLEDVARIKWFLYRYFVVYQLFIFADASPHLKAIVHDELLGSESLSKSGWLSVSEEDEVSKSDAPANTLLLWISHLLMEIGRACEADRPCAQQLVKALTSLRSLGAELSKDMDRAAPLSFLQLLYFLSDLTVVLTPITVLHALGAAHEPYSMYVLPLAATLVVTVAFQGSLVLISESVDPFGSHLGEDHGTNVTLLETAGKLLLLLQTRKDEIEDPLPLVVGDVEPIWAGQGLGWSFDAPQQAGAGEWMYVAPGGYQPGQYQGAPREYIDGLDSFVPGEAYDDDRVSIDADSLALSDVDHSDAAAILADIQRRPPVFNPEGTAGLDMDKQLLKDLGLAGVELVEDATAKAKLAISQQECVKLRHEARHTQKELDDLRRLSVPAEEAEQVIQLLAEWIAPPRPVRLSDVTLAKLAEISRKQSSRVKKILSLSAGRVKSGTLQGINKPPGIQAAEVGAAKATADYKRLIQDLVERLDEENQVSLRLKTQLAEASTLATNMGQIEVHATSTAPPLPPPARSASANRGSQIASRGSVTGATNQPSNNRGSVSMLQERSVSRGLTKEGRLK